MLRLIVNTYADPDPGRNAELESCLVLNQHRHYFDEVIPVEGRPAFADLFGVLNAVAGPDDVTVIANADILFDETIRLAPANHRPGDVWALTRWDVLPAGQPNASEAQFFNREDSQDAWVFRGSVPPRAAERCGFSPGVRGCDNRLAAALAEGGYEVCNPSLEVRSLHLHLSGVRRYGHALTDAVPPPYLLVWPHRLGQNPRHRWLRPGPGGGMIASDR